MSAPLRVERLGPTARVTLNRPEVRNAFNAELIAALTATFVTLGEEPPEALRVVVLAGDGPVFCAGADVAWMRAAASLDRGHQRGRCRTPAPPCSRRSTPARCRS